MEKPQHFAPADVITTMHSDLRPSGKTCHGDYIVRRPRATDAVGRSLRRVFAEAPLPDEWLTLLHRLDHIAH